MCRAGTPVVFSRQLLWIAGFMCALVFLQANLIAQLREQQQALAKQKKLLSQRVKSEQRKRKRIKQKAKQLSNEDLVAVIAEREALAQAQAKAKAKAKARSRSGS